MKSLYNLLGQQNLKCYILHAFEYLIQLTESVRETAQYHGPNRLHFKPFLFLEAQGLSTEVVLQGLQFFNAQFGITNMKIVAQGPCICGATDGTDPRVRPLII